MKGCCSQYAVRINGRSKFAVNKVVDQLHSVQRGHVVVHNTFIAEVDRENARIESRYNDKGKITVRSRWSSVCVQDRLRCPEERGHEIRGETNKWQE